MQTLHFAILPYRSSDGTLNPDFINLVLTDGLGHRAGRSQLFRNPYEESIHMNMGNRNSGAVPRYASPCW